MSLGTNQIAFQRDFRRLMDFIESRGFTFTIGEVMRPKAMQKLYVEQGLSSTMKSQHLKKLAVDLMIGKETKGGFFPTWDKEVLQEFGDYWESLSPENEWGGNWKSFKDTPHFQRNG
jgi:D-alanyl-D-alanine carboxypeptidase